MFNKFGLAATFLSAFSSSTHAEALTKTEKCIVQTVNAISFADAPIQFGALNHVGDNNGFSAYKEASLLFATEPFDSAKHTLDENDSNKEGKTRALPAGGIIRLRILGDFDPDLSRVSFDIYHTGSVFAPLQATGRNGFDALEATINFGLDDATNPQEVTGWHPRMERDIGHHTNNPFSPTEDWILSNRNHGNWITSNLDTILTSFTACVEDKPIPVIETNSTYLPETYDREFYGPFTLNK